MTFSIESKLEERVFSSDVRLPLSSRKTLGVKVILRGSALSSLSHESAFRGFPLRDLSGAASAHRSALFKVNIPC